MRKFLIQNIDDLNKLAYFDGHSQQDALENALAALTTPQAQAEVCEADPLSHFCDGEAETFTWQFLLDDESCWHVTELNDNTWLGA